MFKNGIMIAKNIGWERKEEPSGIMYRNSPHSFSLQQKQKHPVYEFNARFTLQPMHFQEKRIQ